jgi:hypothetical protein
MPATAETAAQRNLFFTIRFINFSNCEKGTRDDAGNRRVIIYSTFVDIQALGSPSRARAELLPQSYMAELVAMFEKNN